MARRPSAQRMSELRGYTPEPRMSRVDQGKRSFIPRPPGYGSSLDRVSGVRPLEFDQPSSSRRFAHSSGVYSRNRSAEHHRSTVGHQRARPESVQRPSTKFIRSNSALSIETPINSRTAKTPMSMSSVNSCRSMGLRTPMNDKNRQLHWILEQALTAVPVKDNRPIADSNWQKVTGNRVISQLKEDQDFNTQSGPVLLKPITIRSFLDINNHLLEKFGGNRFHIDNSNYIDKIPEVARKLLYPGVLTKSWLKSVNAMHTYPHVLAFLSYLIDLAATSDNIRENMTLDKLYVDDQSLMLRHNYYFDAWRIFQETDDFDEVTERYVEDLKLLYDIRDEVYENNKREMAELDKKKAEYAEKLDKLKKEEKHIQTELSGLKNKRADEKGQYVYYTNQIEEATKILGNKKKLLASAKETTDEQQKKVAALRAQLSHQKMDINKRDEYLREIDRTNEVINSKEQLLIQIQKINYEKDLVLANKQKKAFDASIAVNKHILTVGLVAGQSFTNFSISERGLLMPGAVDSINKTCEELKELILHTQTDLQKQVEQKICSEDLKNKIDNVRTGTQTWKTKIHYLEDRIANAERRISKARSERDAYALKVQRALEIKMEGEKIMEKTSEELAEWRNNDMEWRAELEKLKGEEAIVHDHWKTRVECITKEYIKIADEFIESN